MIMVQRLTQSITGSGLHILDSTTIGQMVDIHSDMDGDPASRLDVLCGAITEAFEAFTNRAWMQRVVTEYLSGDGGHLVRLTKAPVATITSFTAAANSVDVETETALVEGTDFDCDGDEGVIWLLSGNFYDAHGNIKAEYTAGYGSSTNAMRVAKSAFVLQFNASWREWDKKQAGLSGQSYGDRTDTKILEPVTLLPEVKTMLEPFKRMSF